jgi:DNA polymerase III alpha subunit
MDGMVNIHVHTEGSLLDGKCVIKKLVERVKELNQNAVAISDHGNLHFVIDFYKACTNAGIKPIIGLEAYVVPDMHFQDIVKEDVERNKQLKKTAKPKKRRKKGEPVVVEEELGSTTVKDAMSRLAENDDRFCGNSSVKVTFDSEGNETYNYKIANSHLLLLARTNEGYKNLIQISSESYLNGFYSKPRIDHAYLREHGTGIIATSACRGGEIPRCILRGRLDLAENLIRMYQDIFDEFYLEIQPGDDPEQRIVNQALIELSEQLNVPLVCTSDAHYLRPEDAESHEILLAINTDDELTLSEKIYYIHSADDMRKAGIPQIAIDNTQAIADKCNVTIEFGKFYLPKIKIPDGYTASSYLTKLSYDSFHDYINENKIDIDLYKKRLDYELDVINSKGLSDYMLLCWDFLNWAQKNEILTGPGRGSVVGCLVSFFLGITSLDPIENGLLFERRLRSLNSVNSVKTLIIKMRIIPSQVA